MLSSLSLLCSDILRGEEFLKLSSVEGFLRCKKIGESVQSLSVITDHLLRTSVLNLDKSLTLGITHTGEESVAHCVILQAGTHVIPCLLNIGYGTCVDSQGITVHLYLSDPSRKALAHDIHKLVECIVALRIVTGILHISAESASGYYGQEGGRGAAKLCHQGVSRLVAGSLTQACGIKLVYISVSELVKGIHILILIGLAISDESDELCVQHLKVGHLGNHNPRLHVDEVLIALSISAVTSETAAKALSQLSELKDCEAHSSVILSMVDSRTFKKLGVNITCEPQYQVKKLYHAK